MEKYRSNLTHEQLTDFIASRVADGMIEGKLETTEEVTTLVHDLLEEAKES